MIPGVIIVKIWSFIIDNTTLFMTSWRRFNLPTSQLYRPASFCSINRHSPVALFNSNFMLHWIFCYKFSSFAACGIHENRLVMFFCWKPFIFALIREALFLISTRRYAVLTDSLVSKTWPILSLNLRRYFQIDVYIPVIIKIICIMILLSNNPLF
jgi:hypothetical protein